MKSQAENNKETDKTTIRLSDLQTNLEILLEIKARTQQIAMIVSFIGLIFAAMLGAAGYIFNSGLAQMIHMGGAMGCLVGSAVGINIIDRVRKKGSVPWYGALLFLGTIIAGLLATHMKARQYGVNIIWPPLAAAAFNSVMVGIIWRLRSSIREFDQYKLLVQKMSNQ